MSGEKRLENYLAKGKVKIEATLKDYIIKKKKKYDGREKLQNCIRQRREVFQNRKNVGNSLLTELQSKTNEMYGELRVQAGVFQMGKLRPQGGRSWGGHPSLQSLPPFHQGERELNPTPQLLWGRQRGARQRGAQPTSTQVHEG